MTTTFPAVPTEARRRLVARFLVTTPMFIGDATQQASTIRPPSIKGALRFWWRALQWPRIHAQGWGVGKALARLHREEAELFGLAAGQQGSNGQARFTLRVEDSDAQSYIDRPKPSAAVSYLLGQGLYHSRDGVLRDAILPGCRFTLVLVERPGRAGPSETQWTSLEEALLVFGLLGGQGARARKGLGSVSLQQLEGGRHAAPQSGEEYQQALGALLAALPLDGSALPPFTAFSGLARLDISRRGDKAMTLLDDLANQQQLYRGYGCECAVNGQRAEKNFADDHDDMLRVAQGAPPQHAPQRTVFGLPHNYYFSSAKVGVSVSTNSRGDRRTSPLFLHVHELPNGECLGVHLILPAVFLPSSDDALKFKPSRGSPQYLPFKPGDIDWTVLHGLLDRFDQRTTLLSPHTRQPDEAQA